jgi:hypothetical protein
MYDLDEVDAPGDTVEDVVPDFMKPEPKEPEEDDKE